jgi:Ca-activated chloride channel family protein
VALLVAIAGAGALVLRPWSGPTCPLPLELRVASSGSKIDLVRDLASQFQEKEAGNTGGCLTVHPVVYPVTSDGALTGLASGWPDDQRADLGPEPDLWLPDSSLEVERLNATMDSAASHPVQVKVSGSVASSPLVLAVTEPLASTLGWPTVQVELPEALDQATTAGGTMRFGRNSPDFSGTGLHATIGLYAAALGVERLSARMLRGDHAAGVLRATELAITPAGGADLTNLLCRLLDTDRPGRPALNAVLVPEQAVSAFNRGQVPGSPCDLNGRKPTLRAFYPSGMPSLDHPFVRMERAPWLTGPRAARVRDALTRFYDFLREEDPQGTIMDARHRTPAPGRVLSPEVSEKEEGILHGGLRPEVKPPDRETVEQLLTGWARARRTARVLLAMDVSGSMRTGSRMADATKAAVHATDHLADGDQIGLWRFARRLGRGGTDQQELVRLGQVGAEARPGRPRGDLVAATLRGLKPTSAGTGLYDTVDAGIGTLRDHHDPRANNAMVVVTDTGASNDPGGISRGGLLRVLGGRPRVLLFVIAIGDADCEASGLAELAGATGGACVDTRSATVEKAFQEVGAVLWGDGR